MQESLHTVDLGTVKLVYVEEGQGNPLVFCHGIPTDYRAWNSQVEFFSASYKTIAYSRRLAYPNQNPENYSESTIENNASDLGALIKSIGLTSINLVGHSYGGFVAAWFALKNPKVVSSLILVEPAVSTILVKDRKNKAEILSLFLSSPSTALSA